MDKLDSMDEEVLINLVRSHALLYDPAHKQYQDQRKRDEAWNAIGHKMKLAGNDCRERWKKLRENYRKALKLRQVQKKRGVKKFKPIKHGSILTFIDNSDLEREDNDAPISKRESALITKREKLERYEEPEQIDPLTVIENNYEAAPKIDTVITFFTSLGETVKTFPEDVQIRVKRDIFKIINEAEEEVLMNKMRGRRGRASSSENYPVEYLEY